MSRIRAYAPVVLLSSFAPSSGVSEAAEIIRSHGRFDQTESVFMTFALTELDRVCAEASEPDWDGNGSAPISRSTAAWAARFLESIPSALPAPEILADVDGEIRLEWFKDPNWVLEVSINDVGVVSYARRFGMDAQHGASLFGQVLPPDVERNLSTFARS